MALNADGLPNVSYIFLAEFDIDEGSVLRHQYPCATGIDQNLLADHMLPDGAHDRNEDWTIFFLNQVPQLTVKNVTPDRNEAPTVLGPTADPNKLLYVISLVRTKKVATVRRGAMVKALAVASHNPYIQVYQPVLLLAIESYFSDFSIDSLKRLYTAINTMDLGQVPSLSRDEKIILRQSDRKDLFQEKFAYDKLRNGDESLPDRNERTSLRSSASTYSLRHRGPGDSHTSFFRRSRSNTIESVEESHMMSSSSSSLTNLSVSRVDNHLLKDTHWYDAKISYNEIQLPIRIPLTSFPYDIGEYSIIKLVQTFSGPVSTVTGPIHPHLHSSGATTPPIIIIYNALLTNKKIVFLGHGLPASDVAHMVLAACGMVSGSGALLEGFAERAFPYTNLTNLDNLENVPGYIAGVCNPAFADKPSWWDVLCNIETGKIIISKDIKSAKPVQIAKHKASESFLSEDADLKSNSGSSKSEFSDFNFIDEITSAVSSHYSETTIRTRFFMYTSRLLRLASRYEEEVYGRTYIGLPSHSFSAASGSRPASLGSGYYYGDDTTVARELISNTGRIEGWRETASYRLYKQSFENNLQRMSLTGIDTEYQILRLRLCKSLSPSEIELIFKNLTERTQTDEQVMHLCTFLSPYYGGALPISFGLFHPSDTVKSYSVEILDKLSQHPTAQTFVESLNTFHKFAFIRLRNERTPGFPNQTSLLNNPSKQLGVIA